MKFFNNKRKKTRINSGSQRGTAITAIIIGIISFSLIIIFLLMITSTSDSRSVYTAVEKLDRSIKAEDNIVKSFAEYSKRIHNPIFKLATERIIEDHEKSIGVIKKNIHIVKIYSKRNYEFLIAVVSVMILHSILLFYFLIRRSARVHGPIHVMSEYMRDIMKDTDPSIRDIRKNDDLQDFYRSFVDLIEKMNRQQERYEKKIDRLLEKSVSTQKTGTVKKKKKNVSKK